MYIRAQKGTRKIHMKLLTVVTSGERLGSQGKSGKGGLQCRALNTAVLMNLSQ